MTRMRYSTFINKFRPDMDERGESLKQYDFNDPAVTNVAPEQEHFIWTMLDCDGKLYIVPQHHYVNRMCYLRTAVPWTDPDLEIRY